MQQEGLHGQPLLAQYTWLEGPRAGPGEASQREGVDLAERGVVGSLATVVLYIYAYKIIRLFCTYARHYLNDIVK